ncbi:hypothetical protein BBP40_001757 [Aspergillus hancockii]|nr:hypothetical protein BBP40_001757 [Aspergillus hancockii]
MDQQPHQILSFQRLKSNKPFTVSLQNGNGPAIPLYDVAPSSSKPNLTISRLQPVYPQHPPPPQYGYAPGTPGPYHQHPHYPPPPHFHPQQYPMAPQYPMSPPLYQQPPPPSQTAKTEIGTVSLSSMSSKITLSIHNIPELKMKRPDFLASSHQFSHPRYGTLTWKESDLFEKRFKLVDSNKTVLARFDKWKLPEQQQQPSKSSLWGGCSSGKKRKAYAFLLFVNADPELLDWIVVSGLGVVEYRIVSDKEWEKELLGDGEDEVLSSLLGA